MTAKIVKLVASPSEGTAIATLDNGNKHLLGFDDLEAARVDMLKDIESGELAEYVESVPDFFRSTDEEIAEAEAYTDLQVVYEAA